MARQKHLLRRLMGTMHDCAADNFKERLAQISVKLGLMLDVKENILGSLHVQPKRFQSAMQHKDWPLNRSYSTCLSLRTTGTEVVGMTEISDMMASMRDAGVTSYERFSRHTAFKERQLDSGE